MILPTMLLVRWLIMPTTVHIYFLGFLFGLPPWLQTSPPTYVPSPLRVRQTFQIRHLGRSVLCDRLPRLQHYHLDFRLYSGIEVLEA